MKRITAAGALAVTVAAVLLALAGQASARNGAASVSGSDNGGVVSGSLEGQIVDTDDTFAAFFATRRLTPSGILTWRAPVVFDGCIEGYGCGTLRLEGHYFYRFKPGTTYYDFEQGGDQPGTVGDPASWISGSSVFRIAGGTERLAGASGVLLFTETVFLTSHTYAGVVHV